MKPILAGCQDGFFHSFGGEAKTKLLHSSLIKNSVAMNKSIRISSIAVPVTLVARDGRIVLFNEGELNEDWIRENFRFRGRFLEYLWDIDEVPLARVVRLLVVLFVPLAQVPLLFGAFMSLTESCAIFEGSRIRADKIEKITLLVEARNRRRFFISKGLFHLWMFLAISVFQYLFWW